MEFKAWRSGKLCVTYSLLILATTSYAQNIHLPETSSDLQKRQIKTDSKPATKVMPEDRQGTVLPSVVIKGSLDNGVGTTDAASSGVVKAISLVDLAVLRPGDTMQSIPGLVVTQHSGDGKANQYFLRGYNLDHGTDFATSVDGVAANMPTHAHGQGYLDLNFLIPELIDHIDYRKGPYDASHGDFASAGSAEVVYKKSLDSNLFDYTVGAHGYERILLAASKPLTKTNAFNLNGPGLIPDAPTLLGALELLHQDGPWQVPEKLQKINGLLKLSDGTSNLGWSLSGAYYTSHWNSTDQVPLSLITEGLLPLFGTMNPSDGGKSSRGVLSGERHEINDQGYRKISLFVEHNTISLWSDFTFFELRPTTGDQFEQNETRNVFGGSWIEGWSHDFFNLDSSSEVGLQLRYDNIRLGLFNTQSRRFVSMVSQEHVGEWVTGVYAQNTTAWAPWAKTVLGARLDHVSMSMSAAESALNSGQAVASQISPKLSVIFGPWAKSEAFFNMGRGFHSNDARGVIDQIDPTTLTHSPSVPALASSFGAEVGIRTEALPHLQSSFSLWQLKSSSELVFNADSSLGSTSPNGASIRDGVEWNNRFTPTEQMFLDFDLAWTKAHYVNMNDNGDEGNHIPNAVGKVGVLRAGIHHWGPWSMGWETRYIGTYPLTQDGSQVAPSALVSNFRIKRKMNERTYLSVDLLNVFNREYYDMVYSQDYQVSLASKPEPNGITVHPGEPRQVRLGLSIGF